MDPTEGFKAGHFGRVSTARRSLVQTSRVQPARQVKPHALDWCFAASYAGLLCSSNGPGFHIKRRRPRVHGFRLPFGCAPCRERMPMMPDFQTLLLQDIGNVREITLNRPKLFNPLDNTSGPELVHALEQADRDDSVRVVVLTGAGKAFSGGGNVRAMAQTLENGESLAGMFAGVAGILNRSIITLRRLSKPVVCALNGVAAGGGLAWALSCDLILAAESARFDPGYIRIALNPDGGNSALVSRLIGLQRASAFFMLGRVIDMATALKWGMVNKVVPDGQVLEEAHALAAELAKAPREALASTKKLLNRAILGDLESILEEERSEIMRLSEMPDFAEGITAFMEKRKPKFS